MSVPHENPLNMSTKHSRLQEELRKGMYFVDEASWHTVAAIFAENPVLLSEDERAKWQPVGPDQLARLGRRLEESLVDAPVPPLAITLHGLRVCADGALIAAFVEDETAGGGFMPLRERAKTVGIEVLEVLTTRPKKLIHVTLGRVLELPAGITDSELADVRGVAGEWAAALLDGRLPGGGGVPGLGRGLTMRSATLTVEKQWWMGDFTQVAEIPMTES